MNRKLMIVVTVILTIGASVVGIALAAGQSGLNEVKQATAPFHQPEKAEAAGYTLVPGLDHCFFKPTVGGMGYHYILTSSLDTELDPRQPEAMVYFGNPGGQLLLGAVEYIVPADAWEAAGNVEPPSVLGRDLHLNAELGVFVLHAWIWKDNPAGVFEDWNPTVSCP